LNKLKLWVSIIGLRSILWVGFSGIVSVGLAFIEIGVAGFLQLFLKSLGILSEDASSFSFVKNFTFTRTEIGFLLILLAFSRAVSNLLVVKGTVTSGQLFNARLRTFSLHQMLLDKVARYISVAQVNLRISELFVKGSEFLSIVNKAACSIIQAGGVFLFLLWLEWHLALFGLCGALVLGLVTLWIYKRVAILSKNIPKQQEKLLKGVERVSRNWLLVRILRTGEKEFNSLAESSLIYAANSIRGMIYSSTAGVFPPFFGVLLIVAIFSLDIKAINISPIDLLAFLYMFLRFLQFLGQAFTFTGSAVMIYPHFSKSMGFMEEAFDQEKVEAAKILERINFLGNISPIDRGEDHSVDARNKADVGDRAVDIDLKNIDFIYPDTDKLILNDLSIACPSGSQLGIVGRSGSGKSTLLAIILGVMKPSRGSVKLGGILPDEYLNSSLLNNVGYVGAEPFLIQGTIKDNLSYGLRGEKADQDYWDALTQAKLFDVIDAKPGRLEFEINENGDGLSAGQKQRLSLARALLVNPKLLVLDEASANVDVATESDIADSINLLKGKTTVIIVSHRKGFLKHSDIIYDFDKDQLIDARS